MSKLRDVIVETFAVILMVLLVLSAAMGWITFTIIIACIGVGMALAIVISITINDWKLAKKEIQQKRKERKESEAGR